MAAKCKRKAPDRVPAWQEDGIPAEVINELSIYQQMVMKGIINEYKTINSGIFQYVKPDTFNTDLMDDILFTNTVCAIVNLGGVLLVRAVMPESFQFNLVDGSPIRFKLAPLSATDVQLGLPQIEFYYNPLDIEGSNAVLVYDAKRDDVPMLTKILPHLYELLEIKAGIWNNVRKINSPVMVACPEESKENVKKMFSRVNAMEPYIMHTNGFTGIDIGKGLSINAGGVESIYPDMRQAYDWVDSHILNILGVINVANDKKERLVKAEAVANTEELSLNLNQRYESRLQAMRDVKRIFGIDVQVNVKFYQDMDSLRASYTDTTPVGSSKAEVGGEEVVPDES